MLTGIDEKIAGEVTMAEKPGQRMKKWREIFKISQTDLANNLDISSSVISDYEKGRRSPGSAFVRDVVRSLIEIDGERGGRVVKRFTPPGQEGILGMGEFPSAVSPIELAEVVKGEKLRLSSKYKRLYGYTIIDSLKAVSSMKSFDYLSIYGWSTERVLFFTGVSSGRSPMVAIRASPLTPAMVVYVQPEEVDELTLKLAEIEDISIFKTELDDKTIEKRLNEL